MPSGVTHLLPRLLRDRFAQARRDVRAIAAQLRGDTQPLAHRQGAARRIAPLAGRTVVVDEVIRETRDAVTLVLRDPTGAPFVFTPGQFFTVCLTLDGQTLRRAYSASSSAHMRDRLHLTVKRVAGGRVSNHLNDAIAPGATLALLGPSGSFTLVPDAAARRRLILLAGGSGITPMMSLLRTLLPVEQATRIDLVYGNRTPDDIIFARALDELAAAHPGRLAVRHRLGLMSRDVVEAELAALAPLDDEALFFVCGPAPMMAEARAALLARGVAPTRILEERFSQPHLRNAAASPASSPSAVTIVVAGTRRTVVAAPGQTLLEAGLAAGLPMSYSCAMGGCAACTVRLVDGDVEMEEPNCLGRDEREAGAVLACVARPRGPITVEVPR
jgi:ferredoxin-NADP reductase